jgi:hypothetical protein
MNGFLSSSQKQKPTNQETMNGTVVAPYIQGILEKICTIGKKFEIRAAFRS